MFFVNKTGQAYGQSSPRATGPEVKGKNDGVRTPPADPGLNSEVVSMADFFH